MFPALDHGPAPGTPLTLPPCAHALPNRTHTLLMSPACPHVPNLVLMGPLMLFICVSPQEALGLERRRGPEAGPRRQRPGPRLSPQLCDCFPLSDTAEALLSLLRKNATKLGKCLAFPGVSHHHWLSYWGPLSSEQCASGEWGCPRASAAPTSADRRPERLAAGRCGGQGSVGWTPFHGLQQPQGHKAALHLGTRSL